MNTTTQAPANGIFNGIYLRTREYDVDVHNLDTAHLMRMNAGHTNMYEKSTDLGMVRPWITTGYMERDGLFDMINTSQGVKRVTLDGHIARFQYPIGQQPTKILEDISGTDTAGIDGTTFKMKFNKPFGNGAILSPDKFLQLEVIVTPDQITGNDASGYVHTVRLNSTNAKFKFLDKSYLQQGTVWFRTGSVGAEYSR